MAWTWEEILTDALSLSGILGEDQVVDAAMLASARTRASKLLDELDGNGIALPVFSTNIEFNTVSGQDTYRLGGDFAAGESPDTVTVETGLVTFGGVTGGFPFVEGQIVTAIEDPDNAGVFMKGKVVSFIDSTLILNVTETGGTTGGGWFFTVTTFRPEIILDAQIEITPGSQPVLLPLRPLTFQDYREYISVPRTLSQPINYTWNPGWPEGSFIIWPNPNQVWKIRLTSTLKWVDVVGNPESSNWLAPASLPSGFTNAFTDVLAYRLAQWRRLVTASLESKYGSAMYLMSTYSFNKVPDVATQPSAFPWNILRSGMNP